MNRDNYLNIYFHPWEFADLKADVPGLPGLITRNSGDAMIHRFDELLRWMKGRGYSFCRIEDFVETSNKNK